MANGPLDIVKQLLNSIFPSQTVVLEKGKPIRYVSDSKKSANVTPPTVPQGPQTAFAAQPQTSMEPTKEDYINAIRIASGKDPVATLSAQIVNEQSKYPIFQKFPFLAVAQSQLESGGLKDFQKIPKLVNKPKQALGWGMGVDSYNPPNVGQVFSDMISGVGGRQGTGYTPSQLRTSQIYQPFRDSGDINQYANIYAGPITSQNPNAGPVYANNLKTVMNKYATVLDSIMKQKGGSYSIRY
jgi:hypothetical protein